jgi:hypothetical protein
MAEQTFCFCFSSGNKRDKARKSRGVRASIAKADASALLNSGMVTVEEMDNSQQISGLLQSNAIATTRLFFDSRYGPVKQSLWRSQHDYGHKESCKSL